MIRIGTEELETAYKKSAIIVFERDGMLGSTYAESTTPFAVSRYTDNLR